MNILLVWPEMPDTFWSFRRALRIAGKKSSLPPIGLLTVAAMLPTGWNKRLVDLNLSSLKNEDLEWADYVFISAMGIQKDSLREVIDACREIGVRIVLGGPIAPFVQKDSDQKVDHFIMKEAEITLPQFLADLENGCTKHIYDTDEMPDLDLSPVPMWELADLGKYAMASVQYSRGCPYDCDFCNITSNFGHRIRCKSADRVIAELNKLHQCGWRGEVLFVDDNFIGNKARVKNELLPALIRWRKNNRGFSFLTEVSINLADDPDLMYMMSMAGFNSVFVGIETTNQQGLAESGKKQNLNRDLLADVKKMQRAGLQVQGGFILGFDSDDPDIFDRMIDFIQESGIATALVGKLQAPPGTRLYARLEHEGRLKGLTTGDHTDGSTNIITLMPEEQFNAGFNKVLAQVYSPKNYYDRVIIFLKEYDKKAARRPFKISDIPAFFRALFAIGALGRERFHFWRLFWGTLFRRPRHLPIAVTLAVYGNHFMKISRKITGGKNQVQE